jgi:alpha/beta superfamily hydrolase
VSDVGVVSDGLWLMGHLARPPLSAGRAVQPGLVVCHGLPVGQQAAATTGHTYPQLADRIAADSGWACLSFWFRGAGTSEGEFSVGGWIADVHAAVAYLREQGVDNVWLAGFSFGGTLAIRAGADDPTIRGVASLSAPSDLSAWSSQPAELLAQTRQVGLVAADSSPDLDQWAQDLVAIDPLGSASRIPPRPFFVVHGASDETVPLADARALADAAEGHCELHVLPKGGHRLRHDPRAIAILLGWLDRQSS